MRKRHCLSVLLMTLAAAAVALADGTSYVGMLATPASTFEPTLTLTAPSNVTLQTYGFGGGTNQAGIVIARLIRLGRSTPHLRKRVSLAAAPSSAILHTCRNKKLAARTIGKNPVLQVNYAAGDVS